MARIPLFPLPQAKARKVAKYFMGWGQGVSRMFPSLDFELEQAGVEMNPREWLGIAVFVFVFYFTLLFGTIFALVLSFSLPPQASVGISLAAGAMVGGMGFMYVSLYPRLTSRRKIKEVEKHLPYALRSILIQIRSGVTLFKSMVSIGWGDYGALSVEFRKAVNEINTGKSEVAALESLARNNPSLFFRRILWQMINAMKSGSDIGTVVKNIVDSISSEQMVSIKKYGSQLNPLALFYMMLVVIFPTLGMVFILILFSFVGATINIEFIMVGILGFLVFVQFMFIGLIKSRRPGGF